MGVNRSLRPPLFAGTKPVTVTSRLPQMLDGDQAIDHRIARQQEHTHPAGADGALNFVAADHTVSGVRHARRRSAFVPLG